MAELAQDFGVPVTFLLVVVVEIDEGTCVELLGVDGLDVDVTAEWVDGEDPPHAESAPAIPLTRTRVRTEDR